MTAVHVSRVVAALALVSGLAGCGAEEPDNAEVFVPDGEAWSEPFDPHQDPVFNPDEEPVTFPELEAHSSRVAAAPDGGEILVGHCDIAPDGTIYVTWQQSQGNQDVWMARSVDGGASFEAPLGIETGPEDTMGGWGTARKPYVAADDTRVVVTYGTARDIGSYAVISSSLEPLTFLAPVEVGTHARDDVEEFIKPYFASDGMLRVMFHRTYMGAEQIMVSREEDGWQPVSVVEDAEGEPCDCCPHDARVNSQGTELIAYRNNVDNIRDPYVATLESSEAAFSTAVAATDNAWEIHGCPVDGPRLEENDAGEELLVWTDPTSGTGRVWIAHSADQGATWSDAAPVVDHGADQFRPSIVTHHDGTVSVTMDQRGGAALLATSTDGGHTFDAPLEVSTDGGLLSAVELCAGGGRAGLVGATDGGELYWVGL